MNELDMQVEGFADKFNKFAARTKVTDFRFASTAFDSKKAYYLNISGGMLGSKSENDILRVFQDILSKAINDKTDFGGVKSLLGSKVTTNVPEDFLKNGSPELKNIVGRGGMGNSVIASMVRYDLLSADSTGVELIMQSLFDSLPATVANPSSPKGSFLLRDFIKDGDAIGKNGVTVKKVNDTSSVRDAYQYFITNLDNYTGNLKYTMFDKLCMESKVHQMKNTYKAVEAFLNIIEQGNLEYAPTLEGLPFFADESKKPTASASQAKKYDIFQIYIPFFLQQVYKLVSVDRGYGFVVKNLGDTSQVENRETKYQRATIKLESGASVEDMKKIHEMYMVDLFLTKKSPLKLDGKLPPLIYCTHEEYDKIRKNGGVIGNVASHLKSAADKQKIAKVS